MTIKWGEEQLWPGLGSPTQGYPGSWNSAWAAEAPDAWDGWFTEGRANPVTNERRAGSYAPNSWLAGGPLRGVAIFNYEDLQREFFRIEGDIQHPSQTPLFADGIYHWWRVLIAGPRELDLPAVNLAAGAEGMASFTIPRHGSRPSKPPTNHLASAKLPGAVNIAFYDGHVETVKLERLWSLYWKKDYVPPEKRPGLK